MEVMFYGTQRYTPLWLPELYTLGVPSVWAVWVLPLAGSVNVGVPVSVGVLVIMVGCEVLPYVMVAIPLVGMTRSLDSQLHGPEGSWVVPALWWISLCPAEVIFRTGGNSRTGAYIMND